MDNQLKLGSGTTITAFILGCIPSLDKPTQDTVIFWFQIGAFAVSILVGLLTACYYIKKLKNNVDKD